VDVLQIPDIAHGEMQEHDCRGRTLTGDSRTSALCEAGAKAPADQPPKPVPPSREEQAVTSVDEEAKARPPSLATTVDQMQDRRGTIPSGDSRVDATPQQGSWQRQGANDMFNPQLFVQGKDLQTVQMADRGSGAKASAAQPERPRKRTKQSTGGTEGEEDMAIPASQRLTRSQSIAEGGKGSSPSPAKTAQGLSMRAHGTSLQRHQHYSRWGSLDYHSLFCPLCYDTQEIVDNSLHLLTGCARLQAPREAVDKAAHDYMVAFPLHAGVARNGAGGRPKGRQLVWGELPARSRMRLLLAFPPVGTGPQACSPGDPAISIEAWTEHFVRATIPHMQTLLKERERIERELRPEAAEAAEEEGEEENEGESEQGESEQ